MGHRNRGEARERGFAWRRNERGLGGVSKNAKSVNFCAHFLRSVLLYTSSALQSRTTSLKFLQSFCVVDSMLRILWVGGDWDDFAKRNGGVAILAGDVLSNRLTQYITDIETADAVVQMVSSVIETQGVLRMDYRCDAPHELRRFRLTIKPMKNRRAILVHELRDALKLDPPMTEWAFDPAARAKKCSVCGLVHLPGKVWSDPAHPGGRHPEFVSYTTCPACTVRIEAAIIGLSTGANAAEVGELSLSAGAGRD